MDVPVSLHLDHGKTLEDVKQAVRAGFTSVMIDGAAFSLKRISLSPVKLSISVNPMVYRLKRSWGRFSAKKMIMSAKPIAKRNRKR